MKRNSTYKETTGPFSLHHNMHTIKFAFFVFYPLVRLILWDRLLLLLRLLLSTLDYFDDDDAAYQLSSLSSCLALVRELLLVRLALRDLLLSLLSTLDSLELTKPAAPGDTDRLLET